VRVELLSHEGCLLADHTRAVVLACIAEVGITTPVIERVGSHPSPTVLIDGQDVMGDPGLAPGIAACRLDTPTRDRVLRVLLTGAAQGETVQGDRQATHDEMERAVTVRERTFAIHRKRPSLSAGEWCNASGVRGIVTPSGVRDTFRGMRIGYGRVSTRDQHPEAQHDALRAAGCDEVFIDRASGKLASRPELTKALLSANRAGDQLVITKLDRLGRSLEHLIELSNQLRARGVDLVVLDQGIDTSTAVGRMFFHILGSIAEFEHALARQMYDELGDDGKRTHTVQQIADEFGVTRPTIYRHLAKASATRPTV
jgi:DNA invertase Pin-like site-specific DNA recombinase